MIAEIIVLSEMEDDGLTDPSGTVIRPSGKSLLVAVRGNLVRAGAKVGEIKVADGRPSFPWSLDGIAYTVVLDNDDAVRLILDTRLSLLQKLFRKKTDAKLMRGIDALVAAVNDHERLDAIQVMRF